MQSVDVVIHFSAMEHPYQRIVLEVASYECSHQKFLCFILRQLSH